MSEKIANLTTDSFKSTLAASATPVLVDFWATWCRPCIAELPNIKRNYDRYHEEGFEVVGITLDRDKAMVERYGHGTPDDWLEQHVYGKHDRIGIGYAVNALSKDHRDFLAAGGMGILIGDGRLNYGSERVLEGYYRVAVTAYASLTADYQNLRNPAYNRDRGPVSILGLRLHIQR